MAARYEIYKVTRGYRWRLKAHNGEVLAFSENYYKTKNGAHKGILAVRYVAAEAVIVDLVPHKRYDLRPTPEEFEQ